MLQAIFSPIRCFKSQSCSSSQSSFLLLLYTECKSSSHDSLDPRENVSKGWNIMAKISGKWCLYMHCACSASNRFLNSSRFSLIILSWECFNSFNYGLHPSFSAASSSRFQISCGPFVSSLISYPGAMPFDPWLITSIMVRNGAARDTAIIQLLWTILVRHVSRERCIVFV